MQRGAGGTVGEGDKDRMECARFPQPHNQGHMKTFTNAHVI